MLFKHNFKVIYVSLKRILNFRGILNRFKGFLDPSTKIVPVILYAASFFCLPRQLDMRGSGNPSVSKIVACLGVKKIR